MTLSKTVADWRTRYSLSLAETQILVIAILESDEHASIADIRNTKVMTIKNQSSSLCKKTGSRNLAHAALRVMRQRFLPEENEEICTP